MKGTPPLVTTAERLGRAHAQKCPPCFDSEQQWSAYLTWAIVADDREVTPIVWTMFKPKGAAEARSKRQARGFNPGFNFCADCTPEYKLEMQLQGRCDPDHLTNWLAPLEAGA